MVQPGAMEPSADILEDICARFILTAPKEVLERREMMFFCVEQSWWYYEDQVRIKFPQFKQFKSYATFAEVLFRECETLKPFLPHLNSWLEDYRKYKQGIPVYGAILLDTAMDQVLLVRGQKTSTGWMFPRGKVNAGEAETECAIREVLEETGYDIRSRLDERAFLEVVADGKKHKLYIVAGLDPNTQEFEPHSKYEVGAYSWHRVADLPDSPEAANRVYMSVDGKRHRFFMVQPFIKPLRKWIRRQQGGAATPQSKSINFMGSPAQLLQALQAGADLNGMTPPPPGLRTSYNGAAAYGAGARNANGNGNGNGSRPVTPAGQRGRAVGTPPNGSDLPAPLATTCLPPQPAATNAVGKPPVAPSPPLKQSPLVLQQQAAAIVPSHSALMLQQLRNGDSYIAAATTAAALNGVTAGMANFKFNKHAILQAMAATAAQ